MNVLEAREQYTDYIDSHVANVYKAWKESENSGIFSSLLDHMDQVQVSSLVKNILDHDRSKYSKEEFEAYRKNFYPITEGEKELNKKHFDKAWDHHYTNNLHHWQGWVDHSTGFAKPMDDIYILEMMCDWIAMGYYNKNTPNQYYEQAKSTINFHPETKDKVETILNAM